MISSELRIGNYVASTNFKYIIKEVGEKYVRIKDINLDYDYNYPLCEITNLKPIPLTEDILIDFGFSNLELDNGEFYYQINKFRLNSNYSGFYYSNNLVIKYVHQLQNLYFCLTGEELIIK